MEQARMHDVLAKMHITSVNVVQPASLQMRPVAPNKPVCAVMGFIAAVALALGLPVLIETKRSMARNSSPERSNIRDEGDFDNRLDANSTEQPKLTELDDHEALLPTTS